MNGPLQHSPQDELFRTRLSTFLKMDRPLVQLVDMINWQRIDEVFGEHFAEGVGRPAKSTRLVVGLLLLRYLNKLSYRETVEAWVENPYWQYFRGEIYFSHEEPVDHTLLCKWVKQMTQTDLEALLRGRCSWPSSKAGRRKASLSTSMWTQPCRRRRSSSPSTAGCTTTRLHGW